MIASQPLRVNKWSKHKLCPEHGLRYLLLQDFNHPSQTGMCSHPTCVEKMISALQSHRLCGGLIKFCRKLDKDRGENEFGVYVIMTLLEGAKRDKPTVLNPFHMRWACLNYLQKLRKDEIRLERHAQILSEIDQILQNEAQDALLDLGFGNIVSGRSRNLEQRNPEKALITKELIEMTISEWGVETYLWLWGELSDIDYCKISGKTPKELKDARKEYKRWYLKVTNEAFL